MERLRQKMRGRRVRQEWCNQRNDIESRKRERQGKGTLREESIDVPTERVEEV